MLPYALFALLTPASAHAVTIGVFSDRQLCAVARPAFVAFYRDFGNAKFQCLPWGFAPLESARPRANPARLEDHR